MSNGFIVSCWTCFSMTL